MRSRAKQILFLAIAAALTVGGLSLANDRGGSDKQGNRGSGNGPGFGPGFGPPREAIDQDVADVLRDVHAAVEKKAPEIADPIIQKAEDSGDITSDQADKLRAAAQAIADGKRPDVDRALLRDADVRKVIRDAFEAAREQTPDIAEPIIQKALDDKKITSAQADKARELVKKLPLPPVGFGHGPGRPPLFGSFDKDVAAVLDDIHTAVEKQEPAIAEPIIKKAVDDGDITEAQADAIRNHKLVGVDRDVFAVLRDIHQAVAKKSLEVAQPIIAKAVDDGKITNAQADKIRNFLKRTPRLRGGPPPFGPPGGRHWGGPDRPGPGPGIAPGVLPGGVPPDAQPAVAAGRPA
jgi:predicted XRE-type DNA-binding protein